MSAGKTTNTKLLNLPISIDQLAYVLERLPQKQLEALEFALDRKGREELSKRVGELDDLRKAGKLLSHQDIRNELGFK